jgi:integrase
VRITVAPPERHIPTADELGRVLGAMRSRVLRPHEGRHGWPWVLLVLAWSTGPRIGEASHLVVGDLDLGDAPEAFLGRHEGARKTGHRSVPLDEATAKVLRDYIERRRIAGETLAPGSSLWPVTHTAIENDGWMRHHVRPACDAAGVPVFRPHDVRAAVVEDLYRRGADPREAADLLGHSVATALGYYRRKRLDRKRALAGLRNAGAVVGGEEAKVVSIEEGKRRG